MPSAGCRAPAPPLGGLEHRCKWKIVAPGTPFPFSFPSSFLPLPFSFLPSLPFTSSHLIAARESGGALKLPQWVRAKSGRQTPSAAFSAYLYSVITARGYAKRGICRRRVSVCLSVCLSHSGIVSKRLNVGSRK